MQLAQRVVLIVEDELDTAEMLAEMMRLSGYQVHKILGGAGAVGQIFHYRPDAVLLDIMMPDCSGYEVLSSLQRDPRLKSIPIVLVSALALPEHVQKGLESGAAAYLTKPVGFRELQATVEKVIQQNLPSV
jgi:DNA-binding response OmpR family regulator